MLSSACSDDIQEEIRKNVLHRVFCLPVFVDVFNDVFIPSLWCTKEDLEVQKTIDLSTILVHDMLAMEVLLKNEWIVARVIVKV